MPYSEYLIQLVTPLVKHPNNVLVEVQKDDMGILLTLRVAGEDMGIVVGKGGETAQALRLLLRTAGLVGNARVSLKIKPI